MKTKSITGEKNAPKLQRKSDKYVVWARELSSRGSSFWIAVLGVILQAAHTSLLLYGTSAFTSEWQKIAVSLGMGLFLSSALMIFTLKHKPGNKQSEFTLNLFFWFEIFIGVFYYLNKLIFSVHKETGEWPGLDNYIYLLIGLPFAYMAPYAIKQFAYVIKSDTSLDYGSIDIIPTEDEETETTSEDLEAAKDEIKSSILEELNELSAPEIDETLIQEKVEEAINEAIKKIDISAPSKNDFDTLKNTTKQLLKDFKADIEQKSDQYIKKGSTITIKTPEGVEKVKIDQEN